MVPLLLWAALATAPFWETRPPAAWSEEELTLLLSNSPWAQTVAGPLQQGGVIVYLATALPARLAEQERWRRDQRAAPGEVPPADEYRQFLKEKAGQVIVLAVRLPVSAALEDEAEQRRLERDCVLKVGRRRYQLAGHFPPGPGDSHLRLVFPRDVRPQDQTLRFELYLPGVPNPYRWAEFRLKEMRYKGAAEY